MPQYMLLTLQKLLCSILSADFTLAVMATKYMTPLLMYSKLKKNAMGKEEGQELLDLLPTKWRLSDFNKCIIWQFTLQWKTEEA